MSEGKLRGSAFYTVLSSFLMVPGILRIRRALQRQSDCKWFRHVLLSLPPEWQHAVYVPHGQIVFRMARALVLGPIGAYDAV
eukprot:3208100-Pyramimonas_sp.AAC.1